MDKGKPRYTIKQLADLAGVTTRTLRHYDAIGLLSPAHTGGNGYRYYDRASLLQLQQILFFRELDLPLGDIARILMQPDFSIRQALEQHRASLQGRASRLARLIRTIDHTLTSIEGENTMTDKDYFEGFDESQYEEEAKKRWGDTPQYAESQRKWASYTKEQKDALKAEGGEITRRMVGEDPLVSPADPAIQAAVGDYYAYLNRYFYTCEVGFLRCLADMWVADPRFAVNYERIRPGGAAFVCDAVHIYCDAHV